MGFRCNGSWAPFVASFDQPMKNISTTRVHFIFSWYYIEAVVICLRVHLPNFGQHSIAENENDVSLDTVIGCQDVTADIHSCRLKMTESSCHFLEQSWLRKGRFWFCGRNQELTKILRWLEACSFEGEGSSIDTAGGEIGLLNGSECTDILALMSPDDRTYIIPKPRRRGQILDHPIDHLRPITTMTPNLAVNTWADPKIISSRLQGDQESTYDPLMTRQPISHPTPSAVATSFSFTTRVIILESSIEQVVVLE